MEGAYFLLLVILIVLAVGVCLFTAAFLAGAYAAHRDRAALGIIEQICGESAAVQGIYTDVRTVPDPPGTPMPQLHHKLAIRFTGSDGFPRRAFIGISSGEPISAKFGAPVALRVFRNPLIQPDECAFDTTRGADGKIRGMIRFCAWNGAPVDETGTVMRETDLNAMLENVRQKAERSRRLRNILLGAGGALLLLIILSGCFFYTRL